MSLIDRYCAGEYEEVVDQLTQSGQADSEAKSVANEIMIRVRANLQTLAQRWRNLGFMLETPLGKPTEKKVLQNLEDVAGKLPLTLLAFYEQIGWTNFVEKPTGSLWPVTEELDPIAVNELTNAQVDEISEAIKEEGGSAQLVLFVDHLLKFNIAGVGPIFLPLPLTGGFDSALYFEDGPVLNADGSKWYFVKYLRETILDRGGMGLAGRPTAEIDTSLLKQLTIDLQPF
jgi:hypothetical protein